MVTKVKAKTIPIRRSFPHDSQNSASPYHLTAARLIILYMDRAEPKKGTEKISECVHEETRQGHPRTGMERVIGASGDYIPISYNTSSANGSNRDRVTPKPDDQVQSTDLEWY
jgi:hypothetical protein